MDKVRVGLVGCGGFMRHRLKQMLAVEEAEIAAMADPDPRQTAETKGLYPELVDVIEYADYYAMVEAGGLDAVLLVTPHNIHCEHVVHAFESGLHVLVEKPLSCSVADAQACIDARDKSGKVGAVSYQRHGLPEFQWLRSKVAGGAYGPVLMVNSMLSQDWKNFVKDTWRQDPETSQGGMLNDSGSHIFDILLWTTGLTPSSVCCFADNRGTAVDIDTATTIKFKDGALATVSVIGHAANWHERHVIALENAMITWTDGKTTLRERGSDEQEVGDWPDATTPDANFIDAVLGRGEVLAPFECGMDVVRLTRACYESAEAGGAVVSL
ncbi:MAG: Gfo/Idh/MocA family oxidoreductase [Armatimonadetes bacterium]|nr:Gfo/Idh/MocA family oxidoreductase [Armatimonadota bacterium]